MLYHSFHISELQINNWQVEQPATVILNVYGLVIGTRCKKNMVGGVLLDLRTRLGSLALLGGVKKRNWPHDITDWGPVAIDSTYWKLHST